jgi:iron complex transport system substrate-binding protein
MTTQRIVSLLPAATEMVCALGLRDQLVGVSHECDFPADVAGLPVLTRPRAAFPPDSEGIDRAVREVMESALSVYEVEAERLVGLRPDLVVTQDLCDVCAVSREQVCAAVAEMAGPEVQVASLTPTRLEHLFDDLARLGEATGRQDEAARQIASLKGRLDELARRADAVGHRPNVLTLEWLAPPMVGGTWMPELVACAGGTTLAASPGDHAPQLTPEQLAALDPAPDVVLIKPCGFDMARTLGEWELLVDLLAPMPWPAIARGGVWLADGNAYFNRPGPRLVDSAEILAACVHPEVFVDLAEQHAAGFVRLDLSAGPPDLG